MNDFVEALAELTVRLGANVQSGQVVALRSEPGKEPLARAIAAAAYRAGAKFVDLSVFDLHLKRARALHADPGTLSWVPPWYGNAVEGLAREGGALIAMSGVAAPGLMADVDPGLQGLDLLPRTRELGEILEARSVNWTAVPCPTEGWAGLVWPELGPEEALARLWEQVAHICRLDEPDPLAAWSERLDRLVEIGEVISGLALDSLHLEGPGTDLRIGMLPGARWTGARWSTRSGIVHVPNLPTEEVFTTPDPARTEGHVRATKPLVTGGAVIEGLEVFFRAGRVSEVRAASGAGVFQALTTPDEGAARLGEVALVDSESRIGQMGTVFYDTLLDENAASHIAIGSGFPFLFADDDETRARVNESEVHLDFMVGSDELSVTGIDTGGREIALLRDGAWQI